MPQTPDDHRNEFVERFDALDRRERVRRLGEARILQDGDTPRLRLPFDATIDVFARGVVRRPGGSVRVTKPVRR